MDPQELLQINLQLIERIVGRVCRRAGLQGADAQDFASEVMVALIEDDYAVLRKYSGRSSFGGFIAVVVEHLLLDRRRETLGKWNPSAEAQRLGEAAVTLERLIYRDGQPLDAALPLVRAIDPAITRAAAEAILDRLPRRTTRPRAVDLDAVDAETVPSHESADARAIASETAKVAEEASRIVREHLDNLAPNDRRLLRLRFGGDMSIADISRALSLPQRPLYRRLEALLADLRVVLQRAGIDASTAAELIGEGDQMPLNFDLRKKSGAHPSFSQEPQ